LVPQLPAWPLAQLKEPFSAIMSGALPTPTRQRRNGSCLAANLGVIAADLMGFAHGVAAMVQANLAQGLTSTEGHAKFIENSELYLKFIRQIDRLAQLERHPPHPLTQGEKRH